jgi:hypothetical protein
MPFPVGDEQIQQAEQALGRALPAGLRERLRRDNGGDVAVEGYPGDDPVWQLHPVQDTGDRRRAKRTADHLVRATEERRAELPEGTVVIAANGTGDLLVLPAGSDDPHWLDHETGDLHPVRTDWS